jgi:hypothetical protein
MLEVNGNINGAFYGVVDGCKWSTRGDTLFIDYSDITEMIYTISGTA